MAIERCGEDLLLTLEATKNNMPTLTDDKLKDLANRINDAIEEYSIETLKGEPRTHLGISEIGAACTRQTWYKFRWMKFDDYDGRMLRLFKRGHREESRYISYLEGIGCKVEQYENGVLHYHPESDSYWLDSEFKTDGLTEDVTGFPQHEAEAAKRGLKRNQFRIQSNICLGHYGGSCDGRAITPWYDDKLLVEFKTHNTKSYVHYVEKGLHKSKPKHFDQMCGYGYHMGLQYAIYFPENKNDDAIEVSVIKLDWQRGMQLEKRAEEIIKSQEPPPKISDNPAFFECAYCIFKNICHNNEIPIKNCRSCRLCKPVENAQWHCSRYNQIIPAEFIIKGCDGWTPL